MNEKKTKAAKPEFKKEGGQGWQKAAAIATVLTLITSTFIGSYGVYLGSRALEVVARFESLKIRPLFEFEYSSWMDPGAKVVFMNIGYGPGTIIGVSAFYETLSGQTIWVSYGKDSVGLRNSKPLNIWTFLGVPGVNDGSHKPITVNWPWIGSTYGPGERVNFLKTPPIDEMTDKWRGIYEEVIQQALSSIRLCFAYETIDQVRIPKSGSTKCGKGPRSGDIIYLGGEEFIVWDFNNIDVSFTEPGYFSQEPTDVVTSAPNAD